MTLEFLVKLIRLILDWSPKPKCSGTYPPFFTIIDWSYEIPDIRFSKEGPLAPRGVRLGDKFSFIGDRLIFRGESIVIFMYKSCLLKPLNFINKTYIPFLYNFHSLDYALQIFEYSINNQFSLFSSSARRLQWFCLFQQPISLKFSAFLLIVIFFLLDFYFLGPLHLFYSGFRIGQTSFHISEYSQVFRFRAYNFLCCFTIR